MRCAYLGDQCWSKAGYVVWVGNAGIMCCGKHLSDARKLGFVDDNTPVQAVKRAK